MIFLQLFGTFFLIGAFTIGGGYAMLPLIQHQVVDVHGWISSQTFTDIVGISQMTPGPIGINSATYIGYTVLENTGASHFMCFLGSCTATFAVVLPSFLIVLGICFAYEKFRNSKLFKTVMQWLRPAVVGLIAAAAVLLMNRENFIDWWSLAILAVAFIATMWLKIHPIITMIACGALGFIIYY